MESIISLITLYHPTAEQIRNAGKIVEQSTMTILIDNSDTSNQEMIDAAGFDGRVKYCPNYDNLGLSKAFNRILKDNTIHHWQDEDFLVFFDQDSTIEDEHISRLVKEYLAIRDQGIPIGCIGPVYFDKSHDAIRTPRNYKSISEDNMIVDSIMTSSMVCTYANIAKAGFWSEDVFLDMADWDICWKMKKCGLLTVMTKKSLLTHEVGQGSRKVGPITLDIAKPFREYYETRDCIYLLKKDYVPFRDRIRFHLQLTLRPLLHLWFLDDKAERKYYIRLGVKDARKGVTGKLDNTKKWAG